MDQFLFLIGYFVIYPALERSICIRDVSQKIDTEESYESIIYYISSAITSGMDKKEVENELRKLGLIEIHHEEELNLPVHSDGIWV